MMNFDPSRYTYPSRRLVTYAGRGMVCTSTPLAAELGLDILKKGGNAVDAAVAMAMALPVLEPTGSGIGGDCFAQIWMEKEHKLYGLNASGRAPQSLTPGLIRSRGYAKMPSLGWCSTLVPGAPAGWAALTGHFGTLPLTELVKPALSYAREGYPVPVAAAQKWAEEAKRILPEAASDPELFRGAKEMFFHGGSVPYTAGERFRCPEMADTLEELAESGAESFYRGKIMRKMVEFSQKTDGIYTEQDFERYRADWATPISAEYKGYTVCELPPNGHGITVLMALNILKGLPLPADREDPAFYHLLIEAVKLALTDARAYVSDPDTLTVTVKELLSEDYAAKRRSLITEKALLPSAGDPRCGGTVYLCTADAEGNMVSYIQSNYHGFGSGIVVPGTGIALQCRAANFSLDPESPNYLQGGKRSYHTIIPGFLMKDGAAVGTFGMTGGFMQPQGHVQMLVNAIDCHMNPQECLDAPRFQWTGGKCIELEPGISPSVAEALRARGHKVSINTDPQEMGKGEIILRTENGCLCGAAEPRADGTAAGW